MLSIVCLTGSRGVREMSRKLARRGGWALVVTQEPDHMQRWSTFGIAALLLLDTRLPGVNAPFVSSLREQALAAPLVCLADRRARKLLIAAGADLVVPLRVRADALFARLAARRADLDYGAIRLEPGERRVCVDGRAVRLTASEQLLLLALLARRGETLSKYDIHTVLGAGADASNVYFHVHNLKLKLGPAASAIENVWGEGYRLALG